MMSSSFFLPAYASKIRFFQRVKAREMKKQLKKAGDHWSLLHVLLRMQQF